MTMEDTVTVKYWQTLRKSSSKPLEKEFAQKKNYLAMIQRYMKEAIEIIAFGLLGVYFILFPFIMIMKIKYYKTLRRKEFRGTSDLFAFFSSEWWVAGITCGFPILGRDKDLK